MRSTIGTILLLASVALLGAAGYDYYTYQRAATLHSQFAWGEMPEFTPRQKANVPILVDNRSGEPLRVVGIKIC
jgi:hypothetical protein